LLRQWLLVHKGGMDPFFDAHRLCHIGYAVPRMDRALKTWMSLGAKLVIPPTLDPIQNVECCLLVYEGAVPVELVSPLPDGPNPLESRLAKGGGLDHVCIFADDVETEVERIRALGGFVVVKPCYGVVWDRTLAFVQTTAGLLVEVMSTSPVGRLANDPLAAVSQA